MDFLGIFGKERFDFTSSLDINLDNTSRGDIIAGNSDSFDDFNDIYGDILLAPSSKVGPNYLSGNNDRDSVSTSLGVSNDTPTRSYSNSIFAGNSILKTGFINNDNNVSYNTPSNINDITSTSNESTPKLIEDACRIEGKKSFDPSYTYIESETHKSTLNDSDDLASDVRPIIPQRRKSPSLSSLPPYPTSQSIISSSSIQNSEKQTNNQSVNILDVQYNNDNKNFINENQLFLPHENPGYNFNIDQNGAFNPVIDGFNFGDFFIDPNGINNEKIKQGLQDNNIENQVLGNSISSIANFSQNISGSSSYLHNSTTMKHSSFYGDASTDNNGNNNNIYNFGVQNRLIQQNNIESFENAKISVPINATGIITDQKLVPVTLSRNEENRILSFGNVNKIDQNPIKEDYQTKKNNTSKANCATQNKKESQRAAARKYREAKKKESSNLANEIEKLKEENAKLSMEISRLKGKYDSYTENAKRIRQVYEKSRWCLESYESAKAVSKVLLGTERKNPIPTETTGSSLFGVLLFIILLIPIFIATPSSIHSFGSFSNMREGISKQTHKNSYLNSYESLPITAPQWTSYGTNNNPNPKFSLATYANAGSPVDFGGRATKGSDFRHFKTEYFMNLLSSTLVSNPPAESLDVPLLRGDSVIPLKKNTTIATQTVPHDLVQVLTGIEETEFDEVSP